MARSAPECEDRRRSRRFRDGSDRTRRGARVQEGTDRARLCREAVRRLGPSDSTPATQGVRPDSATGRVVHRSRLHRSTPRLILPSCRTSGLVHPSSVPPPARAWPASLRASVGSTEAPKDVVARFGVVGPTRASVDSAAAIDTIESTRSSDRRSAAARWREGPTGDGNAPEGHHGC